jgi:hypothetical protein
MEPGDVLRRSWEVYRAHWRHLVIIAAVVLVPLGAVTAPLALLGWPGIVGANVLDLSALFLVNGALVRAVDDVRLGRPDLSVAETFRQTGPRLLVLAVVGVLAAVAIFVGLLLLVVPGLVLLTWWFVLSPVVVLEGQGVLPAFGRSRGLVRGHGWPVFGVAIVTLLVELVVSLTLGAAALPLGGAVSSFVQTAVGNTVVSPFVAVAATLTYFELLGHPTGPGDHLEAGH